MSNVTGKFLIMAGGTGGHLFPALALARKLRDDGYEVEWIGSKDGFEGRYVLDEGLRLHNISIKGLRGKGALSWLLAPVNVIKAVSQARRIIKISKPDCVIGMGGFAAGPGGIAAWLSKKPLVIHEQNAVAGLTNKILFYFSKQVLQAFPNAFAKQHDKLKVTGNPVRIEMTVLDEYEQRKQNRPQNSSLNLLVLGGSQGAEAINEVVAPAIATMSFENVPMLWHQAGKGKDDSTRNLYEKYAINAIVEDFIDDMAAAYAWADLVICRSGALTVAELAAVGVGSILVPYPQAVDDHQAKNAEYLVSAGAAIMIRQTILEPKLLAQKLDQITADPKKLITMAKQARSVGLPNSLELVASHCKKIISQ
ncbi:MAG: undecaprenyldiphospho-muramoylpentapeptide beta-N-acetylglucosaminyltransferase [Pseudomonadales bacterium]|nr:undecaprenyldiphospho-muramoylpentapeptide beta-N-acetylglucosaminyltransferase [Pseudomonadales bacterium]